VELKKQIESLIEAGRNALQRGFEERAFLMWRQRAIDCLAVLFGKDHHYTHYFKTRIVRAEAIDILAGVGVLTAARMAVP
jgi:hypothetical protein